MQEAKIVIGANYGDEGKGLMSRYFCLEAMKENKKPVVILHNGTAQRGHTADFKNGRRHVFHHFGSGALDNVPSYFAGTFLLHPMEFRREFEELETEFGVSPVSYYDPNCIVVTVYDMLADQYTLDYIEEKTGKREYGSCCFGSWCASERKSRPVIGEFKTEDECARLLGIIQKECFDVLKKRVWDYESLYSGHCSLLYGSGYQFMQDLQFFFEHSKPASFKEIADSFDTLIFEGAQGLALDEKAGDEMWHTTSRTGLWNPAKMLSDRQCETEVCYVTRSYETRHGCGEFKESSTLKRIAESIEGRDKTNCPNEFQGTIRYGYLDPLKMQARMDNDVKDASSVNEALLTGDFTQSIALTHYSTCHVPDEFLKKASYISRLPYAENVECRMKNI